MPNNYRIKIVEAGHDYEREIRITDDRVGTIADAEKYVSDCSHHVIDDYPSEFEDLDFLDTGLETIIVVHVAPDAAS